MIFTLCNLDQSIISAASSSLSIFFQNTSYPYKRARSAMMLYMLFCYYNTKWPIVFVIQRAFAVWFDFEPRYFYANSPVLPINIRAATFWA
jgi:hypothetical protein